MTEPPPLLQDVEREKLVQDHIGYVRALAIKVQREFSAPGLDMDEMVAYGSKGLVEASQRFDPQRGVAFTTFAHYRIRGAILDGLRELGWMGRSQHARFVAGTNEYLENQLHRDSSPGGLKDTVNEIYNTMTDVAAIFVTAMGPADRDTADTATPDGATLLETREACDAVRSAVAQLPDKERRMVEMFYFEGRSLQDAGRSLGLSKSWSSRIHARAIQLLSRRLKARGVTAA